MCIYYVLNQTLSGRSATTDLLAVYFRFYLREIKRVADRKQNGNKLTMSMLAHSDEKYHNQRVTISNELSELVKLWWRIEKKTQTDTTIRRLIADFFSYNNKKLIDELSASWLLCAIEFPCPHLSTSDLFLLLILAMTIA